MLIPPTAVFYCTLPTLFIERKTSLWEENITLY